MSGTENEEDGTEGWPITTWFAIMAIAVFVVEVTAAFESLVRAFGVWLAGVLGFALLASIVLERRSQRA